MIDIKIKLKASKVRAYLQKLMRRSRNARFRSLQNTALKQVNTILERTDKGQGSMGRFKPYTNEYEKFNIQSNILMLGYYDTGIYKKLSLSTRKKLLEEIPTKSLGKITDITKVIKELISKDDINGKTIYLDDGIIIKND